MRMGWFGKKEQVRRDPRTGQMSVRVGGRWIEQPVEQMVLRDLQQYFRSRGISPGATVEYLVWAAGFMLGTVLAAMGTADDDPHAGELVRGIHDGLAMGISEGRAALNPSVTAAYKAARGKLP
jgi:hypothetical protein